MLQSRTLCKHIILLQLRNFFPLIGLCCSRRLSSRRLTHITVADLPLGSWFAMQCSGCHGVSRFGRSPCSSLDEKLACLVSPVLHEKCELHRVQGQNPMYLSHATMWNFSSSGSSLLMPSRYQQPVMLGKDTLEFEQILVPCTGGESSRQLRRTMASKESWACRPRLCLHLHPTGPGWDHCVNFRMSKSLEQGTRPQRNPMFLTRQTGATGVCGSGMSFELCERPIKAAVSNGLF